MPPASESARATQLSELESDVAAEAWGWRHTGRKDWALKDITFCLQPGERVLLAGASGSGKSTLLHALAGVLEPEEGESEGSLTVAGRATTDPALRGRSGLVQQDPASQVVMERIGDEVAFGLENIGVPEDEIWGRVQDALTMVGLDLPLDHPTDKLSGGQKQRLALACSLAMRPRVLLLDEPTANLDPQGAQELREHTKRVVADSGATLVVVEHNLEPWLDQVDRIIVLSKGSIIADGPAHQVLAEHGEKLRSDGVWVPGENASDLIDLTGPRAAASSRGAVISSEDLAVGYYQDGPIINEHLNYRFPEGSVTSVVGPNGVGKSTFALTLAGLLPPVSGQILASETLKAGANLPPDPNDWSSTDLLGRVAMVFQEPGYQFLTSTVREELALGLKLKNPQTDPTAKVDRFLTALHLDHLAGANPFSLSGGEKRRLSVATAMINEPQVLILDEPTFGQDRNTWISLVSLLKELAASGTTLVSMTHDELFVQVMGGELQRLEPSTRKRAQEEQRRERPPASKVNPFVALVGLFVLTLPLILTIDPLSAAVALGLELLLLPLLGMSPKQILKRVWPLLLATPFAVISMLLYAAEGGRVFWQLGPAIISENSIQLAVAIGLRILAVGLPSILILSTIDSTQMADALVQIAHLPAKLVLSALAGMRMVSLALSDWKALARARRSRGASGDGRFQAFLKGSLSLLTFAIRRAGVLSTTMEARGFGTTRKRSQARESNLTKADAVMLLVSVSIPLIAIGVAVSAGTFRWFGV